MGNYVRDKIRRQNARLLLPGLARERLTKLRASREGEYT